MKIPSLNIFIFILFFFSKNALCQKKQDLKLQQLIENTVENFQGLIGVYVENTKTGKFAIFNADTLFPTASTIKIPIMVGVFDFIVNGKLKYQDELMYRKSMKYDDGIVGSLEDSTKVPLGEIILLMETISDNTASLWLQGIVGGERINQLMDSLGLANTRVNSRTPGRESFRKTYGWGMTTPREMASLMKMLRNGQVFSKDASDRMYRTLGNQYWDGEGLSQIPSSVKTACKTGAVDKSRSEVTYVHAPNGEYFYCIMTKNQKDTSYARENEGHEVTRKLASLFWNYFEPKSKWKPVDGYEKW
jgi:beta-lactamase class A